MTEYLERYTINISEKISQKPSDYKVFGREKEVAAVGWRARSWKNSHSGRIGLGDFEWNCSSTIKKFNGSITGIIFLDE